LTPEYASPEQIRGDAISTATDVYGLGVVLYELLAGQHPVRRRSPDPVELARVICEDKPEPPSGVALANGDPDLSRKLKGDLDHIVLKAIRKEPDRRYSSVDQLAADIQAHLDGYPVAARVETMAYLAGKFIRRHRLGVSVAVILTLALMAFVTGIVILHGAARRRAICWTTAQIASIANWRMSRMCEQRSSETSPPPTTASVCTTPRSASRSGPTGRER
jgi:eukaryotic-like serine/threonine-protein kinase